MNNYFLRMIVWMAVTAGMSFILIRFFGLIIGLALSFGIFFLMNTMLRKRGFRTSIGGLGRTSLGLGTGITYRCIVCEHRFSGGACPKCGSKMRKAEF